MRHQQALAFDFLRSALFQDALEEHALVGDVLVDDPEAVFVDGEDERVANLSQRAKRGERGRAWSLLQLRCRRRWQGRSRCRGWFLGWFRR